LLKREATVLAFLILVLAAAGIKEPRFFEATSIESILLLMPLLVIVAIGQLLVILTGGIDLSVGAVLGFSGIGVGLILKGNPGLPFPAALAIGLLLGGLLGLVNAGLIVVGKLSPLIVTIGTLATFRGLTFLLSKGDQINSSMIPGSLKNLAINGIPVGQVNLSWLLVMALVAAGGAAFLLRRSAGGRNIFAVGSNANAAHLRGISVPRVQLAVYTICGALAGLAGVMYAARFGFVNPGTAGQGFELSVIAAVAIGGAKLTGGSGSVLGVLLGCLLLSCINVGLTMLGIDANWQMLSYGLVILVGIVADGLMRREPVR
jgi:rhamnose transport system permease protein